jgi:hypothetical protein
MANLNLACDLLGSAVKVPDLKIRLIGKDEHKLLKKVIDKVRSVAGELHDNDIVHTHDQLNAQKDPGAALINIALRDAERLSKEVDRMLFPVCNAWTPVMNVSMNVTSPAPVQSSKR